jgi:hypothetical protein
MTPPALVRLGALVFAGILCLAAPSASEARVRTAAGGAQATGARAIQRPMIQAPTRPVRIEPAARATQAPPSRASTPSAPAVDSLTTGEAGRRAQQLNGGGRILSVDTQDQGYRVKLLKDGEVRVINVSQ